MKMFAVSIAWGLIKSPNFDTANVRGNLFNTQEEVVQLY